MHIKKSGLIICAVLSVVAFYLGLKLSMLYNLSPGKTWLDNLEYTTENLSSDIINHPFSFSGEVSLKFASLCSFAVIAVYFLKIAMWKNYRFHEEYGSARWGTPQDSKPFKNPDPHKNYILTETESMSLSSRMKFTSTEDYNRNKNVLVIGTPGSGKTRNHCKPNLAQMNCSYVITDSKGDLLRECGKMHADNGYEIKVFNLKDPL